jgi:hypothetical protein
MSIGRASPWRRSSTVAVDTCGRSLCWRWRRLHSSRTAPRRRTSRASMATASTRR